MPKVLLIEDDEMTINTIKFMLEREGYEVAVAKDGMEAEKMLDYPADLILLDLILPYKSGFEILKIIREEKKLKMPIIVLSNLGRSEDVYRAMKLGADDYLIKNESSAESIIHKIRAVLPTSVRVFL